MKNLFGAILSGVCFVFLATLSVVVPMTLAGRVNLVKRDVVFVDLCGASRGEDQKDLNVTFYSKEGDETLYVTLRDYASLLSLRLKDGYELSPRGSGQSRVLNGYQNGKLVYQFVADHSSRAFRSAGSFGSAFDTSPDYSHSSIGQDATSSSRTLVSAQGYDTSYYGWLNYSSYYQNSEVYFPLHLLDAELSLETGISHFYDFLRIYQYSDYSQLKTVRPDGENTASEGAEAYYDAHGVPTEALIQLKDTVYYLLDNHYGLAHTRGIASMRDYLEANGIGRRMLSQDRTTSNKAFYEVFGLLDDDHTGIYNAATWWGEDGSLYVRGRNSAARRAVRAQLTELRNQHWAAHGLSADSIQYEGDYAMFGFDGFTVSMDTRGKSEAQIISEDTYYYFKNQMKAIEAHGGVKNVVLDISLNGGGYVGIMAKLLALISPNNLGSCTLFNDKTSAIYAYDYRVDVNKDGEYDAAETFGDDYQFYIMTSDMSFSCGNAFPYYAKLNGFAKILGQRSGGGECTVTAGLLPQGVGFQMSSSNHIGHYEDGLFYGDESGVEPDVAIPYKDFYDLPKIISYIHNEA